jgi:hypothetical protein
MCSGLTWNEGCAVVVSIEYFYLCSSRAPFFNRYLVMLTVVFLSVIQFQRVNLCRVLVAANEIHLFIPYCLKLNIHSYPTVRHYISFLIICSIKKSAVK